jgi:hypothetical protein
MVEDEAWIPADPIANARWELDVAETKVPARTSLRPMYDPDRERIKA